MAEPLTILIIDDCPEDRQVYRRYLQQDQEQCYQILEQESGEDALALCQKLQPDGILLDFLLPDLDGLEFLAELKTLTQDKMPAVVMLTGYGNEAIAVQAMKSGVHDYLVKGQTTGERLRLTVYSAIKKAQLSAELRRSEERLRESQKLIERIAETTPGILYVHDLVEGQNVYLNGQVTNLLGYTPEQIQTLGQEFLSQFMHPDDFAQLPSVFQRFDSAKDGEVLEHEYRMLHADGKWRWFCSRNSIFARNADGSPYQIVGTAFDITDRKQTEQELRDSEQRYRYLSNAVPHLVWITNAQGGCEHFNQRWYDFTGRTVEQSLGFGWSEVVHPDDISAVMQEWIKAIRTGEPYEQEIRYQKYDGSYRWHLARAVPIPDEQGQIVQWFGTSTDIDDYKQLEAERNRLLQLEKAARTEAEAANQAKDEFVAMVSHDLRSPLNAILGWAQLLRTRKFDQTNFIRAVETIEHNARFQSKLLEDLLDISRILRSKLKLELNQVNLAAIIGVAIETAYPSAKAKNIILESRIDQSIPTITGDINRLLQVLGNLLSNAIKFTHPGGKVLVQLLEKNSQAQITVTDTGIGISPEFLPHVFKRYHQADHHYTQGGLGLGLAIARHLVELHDGTIDVTSPGEGQGATFTIHLPLPNELCMNLG
ncbi:PAS domain-containing protein [Anabaena sp. UHCC 0399]|uniref:hybrid sensor histidine kinase/response regulator n=1 Tax=Anabaena sp. UHCC 0399 TaxID=3110238 RepID=UPI002B1F3EF1|nr:PAS domain-containing protein [Anabaena sp. UHCC 0399]MEA5568160.1 PAS domain-containing protein [Anabaena sp. UHCC 0399]